MPDDRTPSETPGDDLHWSIITSPLVYAIRNDRDDVVAMCYSSDDAELILTTLRARMGQGSTDPCRDLRGHAADCAIRFETIPPCSCGKVRTEQGQTEPPDNDCLEDAAKVAESYTGIAGASVIAGAIRRLKHLACARCGKVGPARYERDDGRVCSAECLVKDPDANLNSAPRNESQVSQPPTTTARAPAPAVGDVILVRGVVVRVDTTDGSPEVCFGTVDGLADLQTAWIPPNNIERRTSDASPPIAWGRVREAGRRSVFDIESRRWVHWASFAVEVPEDQGRAARLMLERLTGTGQKEGR